MRQEQRQLCLHKSRSIWDQILPNKPHGGGEEEEGQKTLLRPCSSSVRASQTDEVFRRGGEEGEENWVALEIV